MSPRAITHPLRGPLLITGATGFLGGDLLRELAERNARAGAPAVEVHALARVRPVPEAPHGRSVHWHLGDLRDPAAVEAAMQAVAARARTLGLPAMVIHSGALISYRTRDKEAAYAINVEGTRTLLDAAKRARVGRFLFVSSVVAVGHSMTDRPVDETAPFNCGGLGVDYTDTKRAAEELVLAAAGELDVVVVNPGAVFGPVNRESNTVRFIRQMALGKAPGFAPPGGIGVVGVHDVTDGVLAALERGRCGERYILVESNLTTLELFQRIAHELGVRPVRRVVPRPLWPLLVAGASVWDRFFPMEVTPPQALKMLGLRLALDATKARTELGWSPHSFDEVLRETVAHVAARGLLDPRSVTE